MQSEVCATPSPFTHLLFWREEKSSRHLQDFFEVFEPWCSPEPSLLLHLMLFCSTVQKSDHEILLVPSLKALPPPHHLTLPSPKNTPPEGVENAAT